MLSTKQNNSFFELRNNKLNFLSKNFKQIVENSPHIFMPLS
jgi:hypothetical protein